MKDLDLNEVVDKLFDSNKGLRELIKRENLLVILFCGVRALNSVLRDSPDLSEKDRNIDLELLKFYILVLEKLSYSIIEKLRNYELPYFLRDIKKSIFGAIILKALQEYDKLLLRDLVQNSVDSRSSDQRPEESAEFYKEPYELLEIEGSGSQNLDFIYGVSHSHLIFDAIEDFRSRRAWLGANSFCRAWDYVSLPDLAIKTFSYTRFGFLKSWGYVRIWESIEGLSYRIKDVLDERYNNIVFFMPGYSGNKNKILIVDHFVEAYQKELIDRRDKDLVKLKDRILKEVMKEKSDLKPFVSF